MGISKAMDEGRRRAMALITATALLDHDEADRLLQEIQRLPSAQRPLILIENDDQLAAISTLVWMAIAMADIIAEQSGVDRLAVLQAGFKGIEQRFAQDDED